MTRIPERFDAAMSTGTVGQKAQIVMPAPDTNVAYVITHIGGNLLAFAALAGVYGPPLQLFDGAGLIVARNNMVLNGAAGQSSSYDQELEIILTRGNACTLIFRDPVIANTVQDVLLQGYAI